MIIIPRTIKFFFILENFYTIVSKFDIKIIFNISFRQELLKYIKKQESFVKMQLQNLMQRSQFSGQEENFVTIMVHENENTSKDDKIKKEAYKEIISSDSFIKNYNLIVDNLFIEFSNLNTGIQIADFIIEVVSGMFRGYITSTDLCKKFLINKIRKDKNGNYIGFGILPIPNQKTSPEFTKLILSKLTK